MRMIFVRYRKATLNALALMALILGSENVSAQFKGRFVPYSTVSVGVGSSSYYGDLAPYGRPVASTFGMMRWNVTANYTRHFTDRIAARASFTWARIAGDDYTANRKGQNEFLFARNLHFRNDLKEFALMGIYKIIPDNRSYDRRPQISPYVFLGVAAVAHNPMARVPDLEGDRWQKLQPLGTEGQGAPGQPKEYSLVTLAIPMGVGVRYKLNARFDVSAELGFRYTTSDYLDDAHGGYADPAILKNDQARTFANRSAEPTAARKGGDRTNILSNFITNEYGPIDPGFDPFVAIQQTEYGNPGNRRGTSPGLKDTYLLGNIHLTYILGTPIKCPPLK